MNTIILGDGRWAAPSPPPCVTRAASRRALGRPAGDRRRPAGTSRGTLAGADARRRGVAGRRRRRPTSPPRSTPAARRFVIATTGWDADRAAVEAVLREHGARGRGGARTSASASALFGRLVEAARRAVRRRSTASIRTSSSGTAGRSADRPSGTAQRPARRIVARAIRAWRRRRPRGRRRPGRRVARDAPRRVRCRRRDHRAAADRPRPVRLRGRHPRRRRLAARASPRRPGLHSFDAVVDELLGPRSPPPPDLQTTHSTKGHRP